MIATKAQLRRLGDCPRGAYVVIGMPGMLSTCEYKVARVVDHEPIIGKTKTIPNVKTHTIGRIMYQRGKPVGWFEYAKGWPEHVNHDPEMKVQWYEDELGWL